MDSDGATTTSENKITFKFTNTSDPSLPYKVIAVSESVSFIQAVKFVCRQFNVPSSYVMYLLLLFV